MRFWIGILAGLLAITLPCLFVARAAYKHGFEAGKAQAPVIKPITVLTPPGHCTTQQHMSWWFNGDSTKQRKALKQACKGVMK
jgi:hypothetical protein